jgi:sulfatase maturation enzyme AslB (radical SAM superfamily)
MPKYLVKESPDLKITHADDNSYNSVFNKKTGYFARWGHTKEADPIKGTVEIMDLEISQGTCLDCDFCYKGNGPTQVEHHMSIEEFKTLIQRMPRTLTQIAFGITNIGANKRFLRYD